MNSDQGQTVENLENGADRARNDAACEEMEHLRFYNCRMFDLSLTIGSGVLLVASMMLYSAAQGVFTAVLGAAALTCFAASFFAIVCSYLAGGKAADSAHFWYTGKGTIEHSNRSHKYDRHTNILNRASIYTLGAGLAFQTGFMIACAFINIKA